MLLGLKKRLGIETLTEEEKQTILSDIQKLEFAMGMK